MFSRSSRWHWLWVVALALLLAAAAPVGQRVEANGPPNVVGNPDFSDGLNKWTDQFGAAVIPGVCGAGQVDISGFTTAAIYQNIKIVTPPAGNIWELSVDAQKVEGWGAGMDVFFYDTPECTGTHLRYTNLSTTSGNWETLSDAVEVAGVQCVQVFLQANDPGRGEGCFDNVFVGGTSATTVGLRDLTGQPARQPGGLGLLGGAAVAALAGVVVLLRRTRGH